MGVNINCKQSTEYSVRKTEGELGMYQRFQLWLHTQYCGACKKFDEQMQWVQKRLKQLQTNRLSKQEKEALKKKLANLGKE